MYFCAGVLLNIIHSFKIAHIIFCHFLFYIDAQFVKKIYIPPLLQLKFYTMVSLLYNSVCLNIHTFFYDEN